MFVIYDISIDMLEFITLNGQIPFFLFVTIQNKKGCKDKESIPSSTTRDPVYHMGK